MDKITKKQRSINMSKIRSKNTKPEKTLFKELKKHGYIFKRHSSLPGKPDVQLTRYKTVIFVDGEYWHGKKFNNWKDKLNPFWLKKIGDNIQRDRKNNRLLKKAGWIVIHLWGRDIVKNPSKALSGIHKIIEESYLK